jgi:hypothetical protein
MCVYRRLDAHHHAHTSVSRARTRLGDFFIPAFQCPHRVERVGTLGDGGKWTCGVDRIAKQDKCVIYSFGMPPPPYSVGCIMLTPLLVSSVPC